MYNIIRAYLRPDYRDFVQQYKSNQIIFSGDGIRDWLIKRPKCEDKIKRTMNFFMNEINIKPISDINLHLKLESLLKDEPIERWE